MKQNDNHHKRGCFCALFLYLPTSFAIAARSTQGERVQDDGAAFCLTSTYVLMSSETLTYIMIDAIPWGSIPRGSIG